MTPDTPTPNMFSGIRIIESASLTESGEPCEVRRSWRERLLSRPWRPLKATRTVILQVPMKGGVMIGKNTMAMHPDTLRQLRQLEVSIHGR